MYQGLRWTINLNYVSFGRDCWNKQMTTRPNINNVWVSLTRALDLQHRREFSLIYIMILSSAVTEFRRTFWPPAQSIKVKIESPVFQLLYCQISTANTIIYLLKPTGYGPRHCKFFWQMQNNWKSSYLWWNNATIGKCSMKCVNVNKICNRTLDNIISLWIIKCNSF